MKKEDWEILNALYLYKNVTQAAHALFISQPALSKRLRNIEEEYHCAIAVRTNRGITLTPQGEYLGKEARAYIERLKQIRQDIDLINKEQENAIQISAPSSFSRFVMPNLLKEFHAIYPSIEVKLQVKTSNQIAEMLEKQTIQAGFLNGNACAYERSVLFMQRQGELFYHKPVSIAELPDIPFISHHRSESAGMIIDDWWNERFKRPQKVGMEVTDIETCLEMVKNGFGYTIVFFDIEKELPDLYCIPLTWESGKPLLRNTYFTYCGIQPGDVALKLFADFVCESSANSDM